MLKVKEIRMDYLKEPVGTAGCPSFSWVLESDRKNVMQGMYQLKIKEAVSGKEVFDSGLVESPQSAHIKPDIALRSMTKYAVSLKAADETEESPVSDTAYFITGILNTEEWQAEFISAETKEDRGNSKGTCVGKKIQVTGVVESAYVCTTALGLYHFYINGKKIGADELTPGWTSYHKHLCYQTYDVTDALCQGENTLGAMLGAGWYKGKMGFLHFRNNYGEQTAFLMQLAIRYQDGREEVFVTDKSWQGFDSPVLFSEIYDGEIYDARMEMDHKPAGLRSVLEVAFPKSALTAQAGGRVRKMEELPVKEILITPQGDTVLDFGQNLTGWVEFEIQADAGGGGRASLF